MGCNSLASVEIGSSVTTIGSYAFYNCYGLATVKIPDGVMSIGESAFSYCTSLTSVVIPDSVTSIGWYAFYDCKKLTIYSEASSKPTGWNQEWNYSYGHSNGTNFCSVVWGYKPE